MMKYCSKCGNGNTDESVFCASCGTPLQQAPSMPQQNQPVVAEQPAPSADSSIYNTQTGTYFTDINNQAQSVAPIAPAVPAESNPNTLWLILNIVATLCCCLPAGVAGIIFAAMGTSSFNKGDYEDSQKKSKTAMILFFVAIVLGIISVILIIATGLLGNLANSYY